MAGGKGTTHHRLKGVTGWGMILTLPLAIIFFLGGGINGLTGWLAWLDGPVGAVLLLIFFTTSIWYCKLEFDEVIMDYFDGGLRTFGFLLNKLIAFLAWAAAVYAVVTLAFLG